MKAMKWEDKVARKFYKEYQHLRNNDKVYVQFYKDALENIKTDLALLKVKIDDNEATRTDIHEYTRLNKLKKNVDKTIKVLEKQVSTTYLDDTFRSYKNILQAVSEELGEDIAVGKVNKKLFKELSEYPYTGKPFSERLWLNMTILNSNVIEIITHGLVTGMSYAQMADELQARMNKGLFECHRLIRNESAILLREGKVNAYKDSGVVDKVEWYAALDERMCDICGSLHGKKFDIDKVPVQPHIMCRCTVIPIVK